MRTLIAATLFAIALAGANPAPPAQAMEGTPVLATEPQTYSADEIVNAGHSFFGTTSGGLAGAIENIFSRFGEPNGYILGEEGAGAFVGGLRYGEGAFQMRGFTPSSIFWQGPSVGWDFGGTGSRVMMLAYNVPNPQVMLQRFTGVDGSAYLIGGLSVTVMAADETVLIPVRTGLGARLGVSLGYLKFTSEPTWNPF